MMCYRLLYIVVKKTNKGKCEMCWKSKKPAFCYLSRGRMISSAYSSLNEIGIRTLIGLFLSASGGNGRFASFTILMACLSRISKPLLVCILLSNTLPLASTNIWIIASPCQPRICATFGYCLFLATSRLIKRAYCWLRLWRSPSRGCGVH